MSNVSAPFVPVAVGPDGGRFERLLDPEDSIVANPVLVPFRYQGDIEGLNSILLGPTDDNGKWSPKYMNLLLVFLPISFFLHFNKYPDGWKFWASFLAAAMNMLENST